MSVWQRLDINATNDIRAIKRAYAKQVKITRPDEDPEGFQQLHEAYKEALSLVKQEMALEEEWEAEEEWEQSEYQELGQKSEQEQLNRHKEFDYEAETGLEQPEVGNISISYSVELDYASHDNGALGDKTGNEGIEPVARHSAEEAEHQAYLARQSEMECLNAKVKQQLDNDMLRDDVASWQFLLDSPYILESEFNADLACHVWGMIYQLKQAYRQMQTDEGFTVSEVVDTPVQLQTLDYLDDIFNWRSKVDRISWEMGDEAAEWLYDCLEASSQSVLINHVSGVRGHVVDAKINPRLTEKQLEKGFQAFYSVRVIMSIITGLSMVMGIAAIAHWFNSDEASSSIVVVMISCIYVLSACIGVYKKKRWALWLCWPLAVMLLAGAPVGTITGLLLMWYLYRANRFYPFHFRN